MAKREVVATDTEALIRVTINDEVLELDIDNLNLGEMRLLKQHFGVSDMREIENMEGDPDFIAGIYFLALRRKHPDWEDKRLMNSVNAITVSDLADSQETVVSPKETGS
jgi:hypothetical protein